LLNEKVLTFVTAWSWADVFFSKLARPTYWLALKDTGVAMAFTAGTIAWLVLMGGELELNKEVERSTVELFFLANSASVFVGWSWVVALRDLADAPILRSFGLTAVFGLPENQFTTFLSTLLTVTFTAPLASVLILWLKHLATREVATRAHSLAVGSTQNNAEKWQSRSNFNKIKKMSTTML